MLAVYTFTFIYFN